MRGRPLLLVAPMLAGLLAISAVWADPPGIEGQWDGKLLARLRLELHLDRSTDGTLHGTIISLDQGNAKIPIDIVELKDGALHCELKSIAAGFDGKLSAESDEIEGQWKQGGNAIPLTFRRPGAVPKTSLTPRTFGQIAFAPCRTEDGNTEAYCATHEVYEDRAKAAGRKIALNIMILPALAKEPAPDPIFGFSGGPGGAATREFPASSFVAEWRKTRDVVLIDQRGTGKSNPLRCDVRDLDDAQSMVGDVFDLAKVDACRVASMKAADLRQYTTAAFADDIEEVRAALGYARINVFGGSYGSESALVFLRRHPEHVRTVTLDAVKPTSYKLPLTFAKTIQASLEQLLLACAADAPCHAKYPDLTAELHTILDRLAKAPAQFEMTNPVTTKKQSVTLSRGVFVSDLRLMLYVPQAASQLPAILHLAFQGNWEPFGQMYFSIHRQIEPLISRGLSFAVLCSEDVPAITNAEVKRETAGTWLGDFQVGIYRKACEKWPKGAVSRDFFSPVKSDVPVLLVAGALDPATPVAAAREAARGLTNSRVVEIKEGTHLTNAPCLVDLVSRFIASGSVSGLDTTCVADIHRPPFAVQ